MESLLLMLLAVVIIWWLIGKLPLPEPFAQGKWILYAILIVLVVIRLLQYI